MKGIALVGLVLAGLLGGGELIARYALGLGTPPLSMTHPTIEYMYAPDQDVMRFGNRQLYNEFGMRSPSLADVSQRRRVLVLGDSVVNGGNLTDHAHLATTLASDDGIFFGNASAGSWGPANMAAWLAEFGMIGADTVIIVLSSHDLRDVPAFTPLDPTTHPASAPLSALIEGVTRYLPRYLPLLRTTAETDVDPGNDIEKGRVALQALLDLLSKSRVRTCLVLHQTQAELAAGPDPEHAEILARFAEREIPVVDFSHWTYAPDARAETAFRDNIHLSDRGQQLLALALRDCAARARSLATPEVL